MKAKCLKTLSMLAASGISLAAFSAFGDTATQLNEIKVIGGAGELTAPLAPNKVTKEKIEKQQYTDVTRALKQTSGVYVREEEGQGLRPNIGLRGTNPDRSKKVVLMEDGILSGPAPYSAPAAYYTPSMNHTEGLEVYKGFQAVPYGPNSVGGAINYLSKSLPSKNLDLTLSAGSFETFNLKTQFGNENALINASRWQSKGFKTLDGGGDVGFHKHDALLVAKKSLNEDSDRINNLILRLGYADENSNETYLGLTLNDFNQNPYRRYKASALDKMKWRHTKLQLEHQYQLSSQSLLKTTLYRHDFHRDWYRLDRFQDSSKKLNDILKDPTGSNSIFYGIINGSIDSSAAGASNGNLVLANNDRTYYSQGIQSQLSHVAILDSWTHELDIIARLHQDQISRNHTFDTWSMTSGQLDLVTSNNVDLKNSDTASAQSVSVQDVIRKDAWTLTVAGRFENVNFTNKNELTESETQRSDSVFVPGVGALYQINDSLSVRSSINKATTVAGLDSSGKEQREEATNYELGVRTYSSDLQMNGDLTLFINDYQNITGTCTASTGCASNQLDQQLNGGKALIQGLELSLAKGFQYESVWIPIFINATVLDAQFKNSFTSTSTEWGVGQINSGDPLPYVPQVQYTLGVGAQSGPWEQELTIIYQGAMYDQSLSNNRLQTDAYGIIDWNGKYKISKELGFFAKADNLLGREYITSIKPYGYRPGKPQSFMLGLNWVY